MAKVKVEAGLTIRLGESYEYFKVDVSFEESYDQENLEARNEKYQELKNEVELKLSDSILSGLERVKRIRRKAKKLEEDT